MATLEGQLDRPRGRFAVVAARFNRVITAKLVEGSLRAFRAHGVADGDVDLVWVPGSLEVSLAAQRLASSGRYAAIVCLGAVVRGDTDHYDHVAREAARGVADVSRATGLPVIFGILTTHTVEQAIQRAGPGDSNAGAEAARTAIRMVNLLGQLTPAASPDAPDA